MNNRKATQRTDIRNRIKEALGAASASTATSSPGAPAADFVMVTWSHNIADPKSIRGQLKRAINECGADTRKGKLSGEKLDQAIRGALTAVVKLQIQTGRKKLNGKEQVTAAMKLLRERGIEAPKSLRAEVERIADAGYKQFRSPVGVTLNPRKPRK